MTDETSVTVEPDAVVGVGAAPTATARVTEAHEPTACNNSRCPACIQVAKFRWWLVEAVNALSQTVALPAHDTYEGRAGRTRTTYHRPDCPACRQIREAKNVLVLAEAVLDATV